MEPVVQSTRSTDVLIVTKEKTIMIEFPESSIPSGGATQPRHRKAATECKTVDRSRPGVYHKTSNYTEDSTFKCRP